MVLFLAPGVRPHASEHGTEEGPRRKQARGSALDQDTHGPLPASVHKRTGCDLVQELPDEETEGSQEQRARLARGIVVAVDLEDMCRRYSSSSSSPGSTNRDRR
eukprot:scaffold1439_cov404-Prasinococcus_capsulatus_cf.AAC.74